MTKRNTAGPHCLTDFAYDAYKKSEALMGHFVYQYLVDRQNVLLVLMKVLQFWTVLMIERAKSNCPLCLVLLRHLESLKGDFCQVLENQIQMRKLIYYWMNLAH